jgi:Domain of Unknown Function with PDB structure (DUF3861)
MYRYRVTVEALRGEVTKDSDERTLIAFEARNHDSLFTIVDAVRAKKLFEQDTSAALAIGLKLLAEVVLENRREAPFSEIWQPLQEFIRALKSIPKAE